LGLQGAGWFRSLGLEGVDAILIGLGALGVATVGGGLGITILANLVMSQMVRPLLYNQQVVTYQNGLAVYQGGQIIVLPWADITGIAVDAKFNGFGPLLNRYDLLSADGRHVILEQFLSGFPELIARLRQETLPRLLFHAREQYRLTGRVTFGTLSIEKLSGLNFGGSVTPWAEIERLSISGGEVHVHLRNQQTRDVAVSSIINLDVLIVLANEILPNQ
jgi:hypothetical protein